MIDAYSVPSDWDIAQISKGKIIIECSKMGCVHVTPEVKLSFNTR